MSELIKVDESGKISAKETYEFLELHPAHFASWAKTNIEDNHFALKGRDYEVFTVERENLKGGRPGKDYKLTIDFAKKLCMVSKSERGEQARNYFIEVEKRYKAGQTPPIPELSPQLQLLINLELKQKEHDKAIAETKQELQGIREVVALSPTQLRKDTSNLINKMALKSGGYEHIRAVREESYTLLEQRFGVQLNIRLTNKRKTLALNGVVKSKIDKVNQLDVISDDKKLIEGYIAIVKEMAIKYNVA